MSPDDPRHGTYAGAVAHYVASDPLCQPCRDAKRRYGRRHAKEASLGRARLVDVNLLRKHVAALTRSGLTWSDIARAAGVSLETVGRIADGTTDRVLIKTFRAIAAVPLGTESDTLMPRTIAARKIKALAAIGYPLNVIGREIGTSPQAVSNILNDYGRNRNHVLRSTWDALNDLYDRWHMTPGLSQQTRLMALKRGWPPPLAWEDIDDPDEQPTDWQYRPGDRTEDLRDLAEQGVGITEACRRLQVGHKTLREYCRRHGISDVYHQLAAREVRADNQHTDEVA